MISTAQTVEMIRTTGGVPIDFGAQPQSWCHFERVTVERNDRDGRGVLDKETSALIATRAFSPVPGVGDTVTVHEDDDEDGTFEVSTDWVVRDFDNDEQDGGTLRLFLREP